jgi:S1-C subfamily serine protease
VLPAAACAVPRSPPPREAASRTPAARIAAESFAAVLDPAGGPPFGAAVAVAPLRALTSAHVARAAAAGARGRVRLQRGDGATEAVAAVLAVSDRSDLALLALPEGFLAPAAAAAAPPEVGDPVWAVGPHRLGRAVAAGRVLWTTSAAAPAGGGAGFVARLPALMGYSGGPVVDRGGRLAGITTTALDEAVGAQLLALLAGADLAGLAFGDGRRIFVIGAGAAWAEAGRLAAGAPSAPGPAAPEAAGARRAAAW